MKRLFFSSLIIFCLIIFSCFFCFDNTYAASARRRGTNENISTYGASGYGRDYTSLATWEAATDNNLVSLAQSEVLEVYDDASSFNDYINLAGATTNASYFRIIRPAAGQGHDGTPNNGVTFACTSDQNVFFSGESYSQFQDLIAKSNVSSASNRIVFRPYQYGVCVGCIAVDSTNSGTGLSYGFQLAATNSGLVNCLAHNIGNRGMNLTAAGVFVYNSTSTNNNTNVYFNLASGETATVKNVISSGGSAGDFTDGTGLGTKAVSYSASSNADADDWGGTGNRINQTFSFTNSGSDDFHLTSSDAGARNYGTSLASDSTYAFDDDINNGTMGAGKAGETRPGETSWDIGFDEYPTIISITLTTDGEVGYGYVNLDSEEDTTSSGTNETQIVQNNGNVAEDFDIKTSHATGGTQWSLGSSAGSNTYVHSFSTNGGSSWNMFDAVDTYESMATGVLVSGTEDFDLKIHTPTATSDYNQKTITVTVQASAS